MLCTIYLESTYKHDKIGPRTERIIKIFLMAIDP